MRPRPYPDEAVSSWMMRASARGLIETEEAGYSPATDLDATRDMLRQLDHLPDRGKLLEDLGAHAIRRRWSATVPQDLDASDPSVRTLAKVCEACLAEDVAIITSAGNGASAVVVTGFPRSTSSGRSGRL